MPTSVLDWYHRYLDALDGCQGHHLVGSRRENRAPHALMPPFRLMN
jgi:hypothetical protein